MVQNSLEIRRIQEEDGQHAFKTSECDFDSFNKSGTLYEYCTSDECYGGQYVVYVLAETKSGQIVGLQRIKTELAGAPGLAQTVLADKPAVYLSRIGVVRSKQSFYLGRMLIAHQFYVAKRIAVKNSLKNIIIYWKCRQKDAAYYQNLTKGDIIKKYYDSIWGEAVIMGRELLLY